jgi:ATP-dependent DNA ligase
MPPSDTTRRAGYIPPCIPTRAYKVPSGAGWVHEIKHDGYRLQVRREGEAVRLFTKRGYDWTSRYPATRHRDAAARQVVHARRRVRHRLDRKCKLSDRALSAPISVLGI